MSMMTVATKAAGKKKTGAPPAPRAKAPSASKAGGATPAKKAPGGKPGPPPSTRRRAAARAAQLRTKAGGQIKDKAGDALELGGSHKVVAAEFILCVALVGIGPLLMRKPNGGHVYTPNDFVRLSAIVIVFFVLALMSNSAKGGRIAGAFGALVTLGVLYNASGAVTALGSIFVNSTKRGGIVSTAAAGDETFDTATYTPGLDTNPVQPTTGGTGTVTA